MATGILSDIHGNRWALEAVLEDLDRRRISDVVNLGDSFYGPLDPAGCYRILARESWPTVRGNQDRLLVSESLDRPSSTQEFVCYTLADDGLAWAANEPRSTIVVDGMLLCHGTPERDDVYLLEKVTAGGVFLKRPAELDSTVGDCPHRIILCGHSHLPRAAITASGRLIVNPGSVGLPAYHNEAPHPHAMESGSPHARYAIISEGEPYPHIEHIAVPYDFKQAARVAVSRGRPDWARWLETGRA